MAWRAAERASRRFVRLARQCIFSRSPLADSFGFSILASICIIPKCGYSAGTIQGSDTTSKRREFLSLRLRRASQQSSSCDAQETTYNVCSSSETTWRCQSRVVSKSHQNFENRRNLRGRSASDNVVDTFSSSVASVERPIDSLAKFLTVFRKIPDHCPLVNDSSKA